MEEIKEEQQQQEVNDGTMQQQYCIKHPHRKNPGDGICAFCLQEKLGKLVSSSFPLPITPSSSSSLSSPPSSSPPSFRSNTLSTPLPPTSNSRDHHVRSRIPFLLPKNKKKKPSNSINMNMNMNMNPSSSSAKNVTSDVVFKRSKSTTTPRRTKFLDDEDDDNRDFNIRKRNSFWSFLYLSSSSSKPCNKKIESNINSNSSPRISTVKPKFCSSLGRNCEMVVEEVEDEVEEVSGSSSGSGCLEQRKVSRSRSVGCGSRSFSGDFFEKISTGFGDCTLRRVESQREGNKGNKVISSSNGNIHHCMKERVKCGGIFSGFMMMNSYSSSSSSVADDGEFSHGRNRSSWSWALASPMRAFSSKSTSKENKRDANSEKKNNGPNLSAVPSLLTVRG